MICRRDEHFFDMREPSADRKCLDCGVLWREVDTDCPHPATARISYRDRAAPLGREGETLCDACGQPVED
jgi:hypothetical protein